MNRTAAKCDNVFFGGQCRFCPGFIEPGPTIAKRLFDNAVDGLRISSAASACMQVLTFALNALTKVGIAQVVSGNQIDRASEEAFQPFLQREIGLRVLSRLKIFELDQEIEIAVLGIKIVPGC